MLLSSTSSHADTDKVISYCDHASYPPLSWLKDNELVGVTKDIIQHVFKDQGYQVTLYVLESWKRCMLEVEMGNIDIALAFKTPERSKSFAFSKEYLIEEKIAIFVHKNNSFKFDSWQDLQGKRGGMVLGYSYGDDFDHFLESNTHIERVSSNFQNITKLALNRIDFMPFERNSGILQVQAHGYESVIMPLANNATTDYLYLTTAINNQKILKLMPQLDASIKTLKAGDAVARFTQKSRQQYLQAYPKGSSLRPKPPADIQL
ncbi:transporter substrate-binding domain-containing protein [Dasania sp. GY-MA-18]|uniref:substrate-binding periplasmic protein n=1 Tax=Dasania sp. GY-MA-18 TaxID=2966584 RepID=UPI0021AC5CA4|nr:transporter substrate-binding domain-containing protein [Dasania sp. GY-MA-18]MCR8924284.1 transporter substrate-binding domain-containing protein [Dasania sp. GY-MA-18]